MNSQQKKVVGRLSGALAVFLVLVATVYAWDPQIFPQMVTCSRIIIQNTMKFGATEVTEADLVAVKAGGTLPAVNGSAVTALTAANITAGSQSKSMTFGGNAPVVGSGATRTMLQSGAATSGSTVTFSPVFTAAPSMVCTFGGVTTHKLSIITIATNSFVAADQDGSATNAYYWMAVGTIP